VRSRPGADRTILLFHIISVRPSKQPRMVGSTLGVYSFGLIFVSARTNKRHHHQREWFPHQGVEFEISVSNKSRTGIFGIYLDWF
jgi:hypothetical protein